MSAGEDKEPLGALARWSRRKRQAALGEMPGDEPAEVLVPPAAAESVAPVPAPPADAPAPEASAPATLTDDDMPPLETIGAHSDLSGFFSPKVSEALRRQALRRYFHLPGVHQVDLMNEYEGDFTSFQSLGDLVPEEMRSKLAYEAKRLGKALLGDDEESERPQPEPTAARMEPPKDKEGGSTA